MFNTGSKEIEAMKHLMFIPSLHCSISLMLLVPSFASGTLSEEVEKKPTQKNLFEKVANTSEEFFRGLPKLLSPRNNFFSVLPVPRAWN